MIHSRNQRLDGLRAGISLVYEALCIRIFLASWLIFMFGQADLMKKKPGICKCVNVGLKRPVDISCAFCVDHVSPSLAPGTAIDCVHVHVGSAVGCREFREPA